MERLVSQESGVSLESTVHLGQEERMDLRVLTVLLGLQDLRELLAIKDLLVWWVSLVSVEYLVLRATREEEVTQERLALWVLTADREIADSKASPDHLDSLEKLEAQEILDHPDLSESKDPLV